MGGPPMDKGWAWMCALGAHINMIFVIGGFKSSGILFVEFQSVFECSSAMGALMMGTMSGGMSVVAPFANSIGAKYGYRRVVMFGGFLLFLGAFITSFATRIEHVILAYGLITGAGYGCIFGCSVVIIGLHFRNRLALANGFCMAGGSLGQLAIPPLMRFLLDSYGFRGTLLIFSAILLHVVVAASLFTPASFYTRKCNTVVRSRIYTKVDHVDPRVERIKKLNRFSTSDSDLHRSHLKNLSPMAVRGKRIKTMSECEPGDDYRQRMWQSSSFLHSQTPKQDTDDLSPVVCNHLERGDSGVDSDILSNKLTPKASLYASTSSLGFGPVSQEVCSEKQASIISDKSDKNVSSQCVYIIKTMGWELFNNITYVMYFIGICIGNSGYVNVFLFLPPLAESWNISRNSAALLLSVIGAVDFAGRIAGGFIADFKFIKRNQMMGITILISAIATFICLFFHTYTSLIVLCLIMGLIGGFYISLMGPVLVDFVGVENLSKGIGLVALGIGLFNLPVPTLLGLLKDEIGNYEWSVRICAIQMLVSSFCFGFAPLIHKCAKKGQDKGYGKDDVKAPTLQMAEC